MLYSFPIRMNGQKMNLHLSKHARVRIEERLRDVPVGVMFKLEKILKDGDVSDFVLNDTPIGQCVHIVDADSQVNYVLRVQLDTIVVVTVFSLKVVSVRYEEGSLTETQGLGWGAQSDFAILWKNAQKMLSGLFGEVQSYAGAF